MSKITTTYSQALQAAKDQLAAAGIEDAELEARLLLEAITGFSTSALLTRLRDPMPSEKQRSYQDIVEQRSSTHAPIAYLTGKTEFRDLRIHCEKDVLIPRPETELLVEAAIRHLVKSQCPIQVLELGAGTGIISIAIAKYLETSENRKKNTSTKTQHTPNITAWDPNPAAIALSKKNAAENLQNPDSITWIQEDFFKTATLSIRDSAPKNTTDIMTSELSDLLNSPQPILFLSNPPYIPSADILDLDPDVREHEPHSALDGGTDGLEFYRKIAELFRSRSTGHSTVILEFGIHQKQALEQLFSDYTQLQILKDLAQIPRLLIAQRNPQ